MVRMLFAALLLIAPISIASADTPPFHTGIARLTVSADTPFDMLVWYPTDAEEDPWQVGPFAIPASHNAAVAAGRFPIILLSHGGGTTGGSPLVLRALSADLARQGFVVVAPFHGLAGLPERPLQVTLARDAMLADSRFSSHVDPARLGMLGFSLGGAVTLLLAGAVPNMALVETYCGAHPDDLMSCEHAPGGARRQSPSAQVRPALSPLPLKAIVLLDPLAVPFGKNELTAVTMPVLLFRPELSELPGEANAFGLAASLPHPPEVETVPGRHFIFADVCPAELDSSAPEVCQDPPGIDRASIHVGIAAQIAHFFRTQL